MLHARQWASEGQKQKASDIMHHKKCTCPSELQNLSHREAGHDVLCEEPGWAQAVLSQPSSAPLHPPAPREHTACLPALLPQVHGNEPVLCPLMIKCAITFCLIGCVFIRWSPDRQFGVAQWLLWFAVYKLVWEVANISLPSLDISGSVGSFSVHPHCKRQGGRAWKDTVLPAILWDTHALAKVSSHFPNLLLEARQHRWALDVEEYDSPSCYLLDF